MSRNDFNHAGETSSRHNQNTESNMENTNTTPEARAIWTRPDGVEVEGTATAMMQAFAEAGYKGGLRPVEVPQEEPPARPTMSRCSKTWGSPQGARYSHLVRRWFSGVSTPGALSVRP